MAVIFYIEAIKNRDRLFKNIIVLHAFRFVSNADIIMHGINWKTNIFIVLISIY